MFARKNHHLFSFAKRVIPAEMLHGNKASKPSVITNTNSIFPLIDSACKVQKPPALEYIFVEPYTTRFSLKSLATTALGHSKEVNTSYNPYGHAAIRYTLHDKEYVMNIVGNPSAKKMVNFMKPEEYLFPLDPLTCEATGNEQGKFSILTVYYYYYYY